MRLWQKSFKYYLVVLLFLVLMVSLIYVFFKPQKEKVIEAMVEIPQNTSTKDVAMILKKNGIIENPYFLCFTSNSTTIK